MHQKMYMLVVWLVTTEGASRDSYETNNNETASAIPNESILNLVLKRITCDDDASQLLWLLMLYHLSNPGTWDILRVREAAGTSQV